MALSAIVDRERRASWPHVSIARCLQPSIPRRDLDREGRAAPRLALHEDPARVLLDDPVREREAEASALTDGFRREERIVDLREVGARDPDTRIRNSDDEHVVGRFGLDEEAGALRH